MKGLGWADYIKARGLQFPEGLAWADVPHAEYRRLTRNWQAWRKRRLDNMAKPLVFRHVVKPDGTEWVIRDNGVVAE